MPDEAVTDRLLAVQSAVRMAGQRALEFYRERGHLAVISKGVQDRVTEADRTIEDELRKYLHERFSGDAFFGEESGASDGALDGDGALWVVDPIDGTDCFVFGIPSWCISIAWMHRRQVEIGVIYDPIHNEMFSASLGGGAFLNGSAITVSQATDLRGGLVGIGYSPRVAPDQVLSAIRRVADAGGMFHRCGSGALSLAWVAAGRLLGYFEPHMNAWDCLAGLLLVREAGGWTNDFLAENGLVRGNEAIAAAPGLLGQIQSVCGVSPAAVGADRALGATA
jgi:myo-inositol-1(or 4)-monophosphatase